ncbi:MAG: DegT/DnrJ/EryC1/StrS family aminotransferase [Candidatus Diapherotrites archaeon]|uniref:DegT/DnrJ/EryC1/StrS family aminotransferase n=1 Tax=Candidatus Iainarchaeum sp. TaxID=3101447 RepID=A0A8T3YIY8_9ARCH|nr:DegT/DnrJ/EryC1/StrS family aminotransferase [Candidatus Diapherotrites archaeon]
MITGKNGRGSEAPDGSAFRVPLYRTSFTGNEARYVMDCIETGWVSSTGGYVARFEREFAKYIGVKAATSSSNGTTALHLALLACGIKPGDEVIVPDLTFAATAEAVMHASAKPIIADIDPETLNILPQSVAQKITRKTKAVIPVHLYGRPAPMHEIMEIAERHGIMVIEDAAEAHGAMIGRKKAGAIGHIGVFSFYGNKIMTTGEGGMVVSNDEGAISRAALLKNHGMRKDRRYWHEILGFNYRLTNLQAALGIAQLEKAEEKIALKRKLAANYARMLAPLAAAGTLQLPSEEKGTRNVHWLYWLMAGNPSHQERICASLDSRMIEYRRFFYPLSMMPPFRCRGMKNSIGVYKKGFCIPSFPEITLEEQETVVSAIESAVRTNPY